MALLRQLRHPYLDERVHPDDSSLEVCVRAHERDAERQAGDVRRTAPRRRRRVRHVVAGTRVPRAGNLESLTFDSTGANVDWQTVSWLPTSQPAGTTLK